MIVGRYVQHGKSLHKAFSNTLGGEYKNEAFHGIL